MNSQLKHRLKALETTFASRLKPTARLSENRRLWLLNIMLDESLPPEETERRLRAIGAAYDLARVTRVRELIAIAQLRKDRGEQPCSAI